MRSRKSVGIRFQYTQLPKGSLSGIPSQRTSVRLAPLGPIPRSETPVVVGWEMKLVFRRKRPNPGTRLSASSTRVPGEFERSSLSTAVTSATESTIVSSPRVAVTTTVSVWDWGAVSSSSWV